MFSLSVSILFSIHIYNHFQIPIPTSGIVISFKHGDQSLDEALKDQIIKSLSKELSKHHDNSYQMMTHRLQTTFNLDWIRIVQVSPDQIVLSLKKREPFAEVILDKPYKSTKEGQVYEFHETTKKPAISIDLSVLKGHQQKATDNTISLTTEQQNMLQQALDLYHQLKLQGFATETINYHDYRGLSAELKGGLVIFFGIKPFHDKIERLNQTIKHLKSQGVIATRIELDYDGKAFVSKKTTL